MLETIANGLEPLIFDGSEGVIAVVFYSLRNLVKLMSRFGISQIAYVLMIMLLLVVVTTRAVI